MKKFSTINKVDLQDDQPKSYNETLTALFDDMITTKITGDAGELAGKFDVSIDGKEKFIAIVEKLTNVHILKERAKLLESFKVNAFKNNTLNWVDDDVKLIKESIDKLIKGEVVVNGVQMTAEDKLIIESKSNDSQQ